MKSKASPGSTGPIRQPTPRGRERDEPPVADPAADAPACPHCPHCRAAISVRYGHVRGEQRWRCQACKRTFGSSTGTALMGLHRKAEWRTFAQSMSEGLSVSQAAERSGIHRDTASRWRRRTLDVPPHVAAAPRSIDADTAPGRQRRPRGSGPVTDARALRTRQALHSALLSLIARRQFEELTVRDIAAEAGVGYATFFRHHSSKAQLLNEVAKEQVGNLAANALPLVEGFSPRAACVLLCRFVNQQRGLWSTLLTGGAAGPLRQEFIRLAREHSRVRSSPWLPVDLGSTHGVSATIEILAWWLRNPGQQSADQIAEILYRLVVQPLMAGSFPVAP
jgi:transposase-like protein